MSLQTLFSSSNLPLPSIRARKVNVGGVAVQVWGLEHLTGAPVAIMFFLHGRTRMKEDMFECTQYILGRIWERQEKADARDKGKDLLIVTLDNRNHGERVVDDLSNMGWDKNPNHAIDMYAIQTANALEISHIVSFLPAYLFPDNAEPSGSPVVTWICAGVSLGGHSTWLAARDPRLTHLIPIIGSPDFLTLLSNRAKQQNVTLEPPLWPHALAAQIRSSDPVHFPSSTWTDKRILVLSGAKDKLVPHVEGGAEAFIVHLKSSEVGPKIDVLVDEDAGHQTTVKMVDRMVEWLWEEVVRPGAGADLGRSAL